MMADVQPRTSPILAYQFVELCVSTSFLKVFVDAMIATQLTNNEPQTWLILITIGRMLCFPQFFEAFLSARLQLNYKKKTIGLDKSAASNPQCFDACRRQASQADQWNSRPCRRLIPAFRLLSPTSVGRIWCPKATWSLRRQKGLQMNNL